MGDLPFTLISGVVGFLAGAIIGAVYFGIPGEAIFGILGAWLVTFLLRRKHDPSAE